MPRDYRSVARVEPFLVFNEYTLDAGQENKKERVMVECNFTRTRHQTFFFSIFVDMTKIKSTKIYSKTKQIIILTKFNAHILLLNHMLLLKKKNFH